MRNAVEKLTEIIKINYFNFHFDKLGYKNRPLFHTTDMLTSQVTLPGST